MTDPDHYKPYIRCMHAKQLNLALKWHAFVHETTWSLQEEEKTEGAPSQRHCFITGRLRYAVDTDDC